MDVDRQRRAEAIEVTAARRAFQLVYQPIVNLDTGDVAGVEALTRFQDGRSPHRWFQEAEDLGVSAALDLAIIEVALSDLAELPAGYLSVNLSPSTLLEPGLLDLLGGPDVPLDRLVIEITEHARMSNYGHARRALDVLRRRGVHLAIDDAGAGYATFRHVLRLHPDIIKMDQSITQRINEDPARMALATALVIFAGEIGAVVVAEGAETASELVALQAAGVSRAQGFALARPQSLPLVLPPDDRLPVAAPSGGRTPATAAPPWATFDDETVAIAAHGLLSPVGGVELALDLLRRKTEEIGEDECVALVGTAQRQMRLVGGVLQDIVRGLAPGTLIVLDEISGVRSDQPEVRSSGRSS